MPKPSPHRVVTVALALVLAALSLADYLAWRSHRHRLLALLAEVGTAGRLPEVAADVRREPESPRAALRAARGLLADELDLRYRSDQAPEEAARARDASPARLAGASRLAAGALRDQPASWQGAMVLGGAAFLELSRGRDARLATRAELWQGPLERARELAPGQPEPTRLLAAAYLNLWSRLDAEGRQRAAPVVAEALADPRGFQLLIEPWLRAAPTLGDALAAIPDRPAAWRQLERIFARDGDWERLCRARAGAEAALGRHLAALVEEAAERRRGGDPSGARRRLLTVAVEAPPSLRFSPLFATVLERLPPGPVAGHQERAFRTWLDWALDRCLLFECPFAGPRMRRLADLSAPREAPLLATAALAAGDERRAALYERRAPPGAAPEWSRFHLLKARRALARDEPAAARAALRRVDAESQAGPLYARLWSASRPEAAAAAGADAPAALGLPAELWRQRGYAARLELAAPAGSYRLDVEIAGTAPEGGAVEVLWDGELVERRPLGPGESLRLALEAVGDLHLLEVRRLEGRPGSPGRVILTPQS